MSMVTLTHCVVRVQRLHPPTNITFTLLLIGYYSAFNAKNYGEIKPVNLVKADLLGGNLRIYHSPQY